MNLVVRGYFKTILIFVLSQCPLIGLIAQKLTGEKPILDSAAVANWPELQGAEISPFGRYIAYSINVPASGNNTFFVKDCQSSWIKAFNNVQYGYFSGDDKQIIFQSNDSLFFESLDGNIPTRIVKMRSFSFPYAGAGKWLSYQEVGDSGELVIMNVMDGSKRFLGKGLNCQFEKTGKFLILKNKSPIDSNTKDRLWVLNPETGSLTNIWSGEEGEEAADFQFDEDGRQLAFITTRRSLTHTLWYYRIGTGKAEVKASDDDPGTARHMQVSGPIRFSRNGNCLYFSLLEPDIRKDVNKSAPSGANVDVWGYKDRIIQPGQLTKKEIPTTFTGVIFTTRNNYAHIETNVEKMAYPPEFCTGDRIIVTRPDSTGKADPRLGFSYAPMYFVKFLSTNAVRPIGKFVEAISMSPDGKWIVYFDRVEKDFISYNVETGEHLNLTARLPAPVNCDVVKSIYPSPAAPVAGWLKADMTVLIYDNYDLWAIDPSGRKAPKCLTSRYGILHHVKMRLIDDEEKVYKYGDTLLFTGFNDLTKYNGFLRLILGKNQDPEDLNMGPYTYYRVESQKPDQHAYDNGMRPIKASSSNCWLVKRETASEAPNYYLTTDFHTYKRVTDFSPQIKYNWVVAELVNFRQLDGSACQGVLYKPENFKPLKKYPIIFNYYQYFSHRLYEFPRPDFFQTNIDIPWLVSRGYLVFTPDIHYNLATEIRKNVGFCAYNSIVAAATYLSRLPFVDSRRMGLQGHSFGAFATNYLITHTHMFASACEMAGVTDFVSSYLTLLPSGDPGTEDHENQAIFEQGQVRMGATLWQRPELYLQGSAVLRADRITTPLLIVHNKHDGAVQWRQGVELYMALRRLEKPVWMLQYDEGGHSVTGRDAWDYTVRLTQFFDYYLKGALPPKWMTRGIPASRKGLDNGCELDSTGRRP